MRLASVVLAAVLSGAGCASTEFSPSGGGDALPAHTGGVEVLERLPPDGAYRLIGIVTVRGVALTSDERMFDRLRESAAARGADAVVPQGPIRTRPTGDGGEDRALAAYAIRRR